MYSIYQWIMITLTSYSVTTACHEGLGYISMEINQLNHLLGEKQLPERRIVPPEETPNAVVDTPESDIRNKHILCIWANV